MDEKHEQDQYFFDRDTLEHLAGFLGSFPRVCLLCAPMLGRVMSAQRGGVTVLDIDERFCQVQGFRYWNIYRPEAVQEDFDLVVCDPPFHKVSLSQLFRAIRVLTRFRADHRLLVSYLWRRQHAVVGTFRTYALEPTGYFPAYATVPLL